VNKQRGPGVRGGGGKRGVPNEVKKSCSVKWGGGQDDTNLPPAHPWEELDAGFTELKERSGRA